jgi:hypothetical protein
MFDRHQRTIHTVIPLPKRSAIPAGVCDVGKAFIMERTAHKSTNTMRAITMREQGA